MEKKRKYIYTVFAVFILFLAALFAAWLFEALPSPESNISARAVSHTVNEEDNSSQMLYASGVPIGIYIKTDGILVLGTQQVRTENGQIVSPCTQKLKAGDYILAINNEPILSKKHFSQLLQKNGKQQITLTILRKGEKQDIQITPVYSPDEKEYQIGAWIRNDTQGIGTVTYIRPDGTFAALGHGINDYDLGVHLNISGGSVYQTNISAIMKGKADNPGEIIGSIKYIPENYLGNIRKNTEGGIFGTIKKEKSSFQLGELLPVADFSEIKKGKAFLRTSISGVSTDYTVKIEKITKNRKNKLKSLQIKVTDERLLQLTGGIVQGLSGSPLIQYGKIIGAVTHVLVSDPSKGYGIAVETMLQEEK